MENDCFAEILMAMANLNCEDKLFEEKSAALIQLNTLIDSYAKEGFRGDLVEQIANKKTAFICGATTKAELKEIFEPPKIHYDYNKIHPVGKHHILEEELICWSLASLRAPLVKHGFDRYMEVFKKVFPEIKLNIEGA